MTASTRKLGRIKPHVVPRFHFRDFLEPGATAPAEVHRTDRQFNWPMLANGPDPSVTVNPIVASYGVGDCVIARTLHAIQHMHISAGTSVPTFHGDDALALYSAVTGYDPSQTDDQGNNPTDQGTDPSVMDNYWQNTGVKFPDGTVDKIAGFLQVSPTNPNEWGLGIAEFDFLGAGYNLTQSAETSNLWQVIPNDPVVGGHEVMHNSYDAERLNVNCWGEDAVNLLVTRGYLTAQCDQLTIYLSHDVLNKNGISNLGFNYTKLQQAFSAL